MGLWNLSVKQLAVLNSKEEFRPGFRSVWEISRTAPRAVDDQTFNFVIFMSRPAPLASVIFTARGP